MIFYVCGTVKRRSEVETRILELLAQRETSVEALAERIGLSLANASQHLRLLRAAGLLTSVRAASLNGESPSETGEFTCQPVR